MRVQINYDDKKYATFIQQNAPLTASQLYEVARNGSFFISQAYHDELVCIASHEAQERALHGKLSIEFTKLFDEYKIAPVAMKRSFSRAMQPLRQQILESDGRLFEINRKEIEVSRSKKGFSEVSKAVLPLLAMQKDLMDTLAEGSYDFTIHDRKITLILTYDDPDC